MKKIVCLIGVLYCLYSDSYCQNRFDLLITEIMADPSPVVSLPNNEWVEIKNNSRQSINLQGWRLGDATGISGAFPSYILKADSFLIICSSGSLSAMQGFGPAISVTSFPSLDNDGETIYLRAPNTKTIHAVGYSSSWYKNELKKEGGWTLEMMDTHDPCSGSGNWKASIDPRGGSPGKINSVDTLNPDQSKPVLEKAYISDSLNIILRFDEPVDSSQAVIGSNYAIEAGPAIAGITSIPPLFNEVRLRLSSPLQKEIIYELRINGIKDCLGNSIQSDTRIKTGIPSDPLTGEWIINEILFDPKPGGYDYVEFYNNSKKIFDAGRLFIANRSSGGVVGSIKVLSPEPRYILPGEFLVVTEDSSALSRDYQVKNKKNILELSSLPSFPDDEGIVVALKFQGIIEDELAYKDDWQFGLLHDKAGVALERIDPKAPTQERSNWHSASSTAGNGTPGYENSQYKLIGESASRIELMQKIFSPDNDGFEDIATIQYKMDAPGYMAQVRIYDMEGREIRYLVKNVLLGRNGSWNWDGLDEKGQKLPIGHYVIVTDVFDLNGKRKMEKFLIVLARRI